MEFSTAHRIDQNMSSFNPNLSNSAEARLPVLVNLSTNERHTVVGKSFKVGRAPDNQLVLEDDGYTSAEHARFYWNQGWWIEDLMSSNGTHVNDQLLTEPLQLSPGDVVKIGRTSFRIE
jgi:pSer/pThr/pTyr-binding forkhead associated (FHA) protein